MSRFGPTKAYRQRVRRVAQGCYRISWLIDYYYPTSRIRHPRLFERDTDEAGARRFAKKWKLEMPS